VCAPPIGQQRKLVCPDNILAELRVWCVEGDIDLENLNCIVSVMSFDEGAEGVFVDVIVNNVNRMAVVRAMAVLLVEVDDFYHHMADDHKDHCIGLTSTTNSSLSPTDQNQQFLYFEVMGIICVFWIFFCDSVIFDNDLRR
jgi:hypothetical protein